MKNWLINFFGKGDTPEFALFTPAHLMPVLAMLGLIYLIYRRRDFLRTWKREEALRYVLAFMLLLADMSYYWRVRPGSALARRRLSPSACADGRRSCAASCSPAKSRDSLTSCTSGFSPARSSR